VTGSRATRSAKIGPIYGDETAPLTRGTFGTRPAPIGAVVRVLDASAKPKSYRLRLGTCVIGSGPTCDIVVSERTVSRVHAELGLVPEGVSVVDKSSRNGTFYQGQRIEKMVLGLGGRIQVGAATIAIDADSEALSEGLSYEHPEYRGMVGVSRSMHGLFALLSRLEGSLATVLVQGESGVGKELVARALHEGSSVSAGPFVAVNCGAIAREVIASELFGHKKGAFTGAVEARKGAFESANGGTLFLDEVGELPLDMQPMLLRALELGEIRAVGEDLPRQVKVRLVAATNRDLEAEARAGTFRQDLFYRLAVVRLSVPPLRERVPDIEPMAMHFARKAGLPELSAGVIQELRCRAWPGNVRELQNAIQSYAALGVLPGAPSSELDHLEVGLSELADPTRPYAEQKEALTERFTVIYLKSLMDHAHGNQSEAARVSGLNRGYLGRLLSRFGLTRGAAGSRGEGER